MKSSRNGPKTYTRRTRSFRAVYAECRKSLSCIVGLGRVELPTSRLSGACSERGSVSVRGDSSKFRPARHGHNVGEARPKVTAHAYTTRTRENARGAA